MDFETPSDETFAPESPDCGAAVIGRGDVWVALPGPSSERRIALEGRGKPAVPLRVCRAVLEDGRLELADPDPVAAAALAGLLHGGRCGRA